MKLEQKLLEEIYTFKIKYPLNLIFPDHKGYVWHNIVYTKFGIVSVSQQPTINNKNVCWILLRMEVNGEIVQTSIFKKGTLYTARYLGFLANKWGKLVSEMKK